MYQVVAISNDETGISMDPDVRLRSCQENCRAAPWIFGIKPCDIVVDPLVMPIGALGDARPAGFRAASPTCVMSSRSTPLAACPTSLSGLPHRHGINAGFIPMVIGAGMTVPS